MRKRPAASQDAFDYATTHAAVDGIRVGIGGWVFVPWRDNFYPAGLVQRRELEYASRHVTAIEINGTYYGAQKPATYAKWRDETPDGFLFSAKAPKRIMATRALANTGGAVGEFVGGIAELGAKLGPLVWQFEQGLQIDRDQFTSFLDLLPKQINGRPLRHVLDVRDRAFIDDAYLSLARHHGMATVFTDSPDHPSFADVTADFVYARLMRARTDIATGYADAELAQWALRAKIWAGGGEPDDLPHIGPSAVVAGARDVFVYFISAAKERNPAAAMALIERLNSLGA